MNKKKLNFNLDFLGLSDEEQPINYENDWDGILDCIEYIPTKALLKKLAKPLSVNKSELVIGFKNQKIVDMIYSTNKIAHIEEACNKYYKQNNSIVILLNEQTTENNKTAEGILDIGNNVDTKSESKKNENSNSSKNNNNVDSSDINWKPLFIIILVLAIICTIGFTITVKQKKKIILTK